MKRIAVIAFAVALGLAWTGAAIPADVKQETKEKASDTKETLKDTGESAKDKMKDAGEKVKDTGVKAKDKAVELKDKAKDKISGDKDSGEGPAKASAQVRSAQQALVDKGYNPGPVDGLMGPRTKAAVTDFQRKEGLEANGRLDMQTMSRLGAQARASEVPTTAPSATPSASPPTQPGGSKSQKP
jgi:peptidoglycan hydrolase-like protein with peptidoglycan-binding domain